MSYKKFILCMIICFFSWGELNYYNEIEGYE